MSSSAVWPCAALRDADLSARTTMRVGGRVEWLLEPATPGELRAAVCAAREAGHAPRILGGGANLIVEGGELPGVVIATERMRRLFRPQDEDDPGELELDPAQIAPRMAPLERERDPRLVAWCGSTLPSLVKAARELGWSGLEGLAGVPGQLGGGLAMNAGGRWGDLWDVVERVWVLDEQGELIQLARADCDPRYRDGNLGGRLAVGALLRLSVDAVARVKAATREYLIEKNRVQPVSEWSSGCVFKNPDPELSDGRSAGRLVDECGGKGRARGDAMVSPRHGNFIVNRGAATAADVLTLIEDVRDLVAQKTGLYLETEVQIWRQPG
jgi:UDP-N-acetylmuramate dehydrogenase